MKVGVLMGTAYLFTREIVSSGAIVVGLPGRRAELHADAAISNPAPATPRAASIPRSPATSTTRAAS